MKKRSALSALLFLSCCFAADPAVEFSFFEKPGLEKPLLSIEGEENFLPWTIAVKDSPAGKIFKNPKRLPLYTVEFQPIAPEPGWIYEMNMKFIGQEGTALHIYGVEYAGTVQRSNHVLLRTRSALNVNGVTGYSKEFAVAPGCTELRTSLTVASAGKTGHTTELLVEKLSIRKVAPMKQASSEIRKINLAEDYDLSKYPEGSFPKMSKGYGENAKHWPNVKAEIVKVDGENLLHIVRTKDQYIYPFMELKPFPVDPRYYYIRLTFEIKGKGTVAPGLWWKRRSLSWDYFHGKKVTLTDDWQTVTVVHPCMTPDVKSATMSFTGGGDGEFWIRNISANME